MEGSKRYYKDLNKLWKEGLIDKEVFVQNYDTYLSKIAQGRVVGFYDQWWQFGYDAEAITQKCKEIQQNAHFIPCCLQRCAKSKISYDSTNRSSRWNQYYQEM